MILTWLAQAPTPLPVRDIAPPVRLFPFSPTTMAAAAVAALALVLLIAWLLHRWWRNRPAAPPPTPQEIALRQLAEARRSLETTEPYAFSILVSDILRSYFSARYLIPATQQTSPEFLASLHGFRSFQEDEKRLLAQFLERCDLIKFARMEATAADSERLLEEATAVVKGGGHESIR